jgi:hypothetical protein
MGRPLKEVQMKLTGWSLWSLALLFGFVVSLTAELWLSHAWHLLERAAAFALIFAALSLIVRAGFKPLGGIKAHCKRLAKIS